MNNNTSIIQIFRILTIREKILKCIKELGVNDLRFINNLTLSSSIERSARLVKTKVYIKGSDLIRLTRSLCLNVFNDLHPSIDGWSAWSYHYPFYKEEVSSRGIPNCTLGSIGSFALPWDFIKHYLPSQCQLIDSTKRSTAIGRYCSHPNATLATLEHLIAWSPDFCPGPNVLDNVAASGRLDIFKYLEHRYKDTIVCSTQAIDGAALNGHVEMIDYLYKNRQEQCTVAAIENACRNGHLKVLEYLRNHHPIWQFCSFNSWLLAAGGGHTNVLEFHKLYTNNNNNNYDINTGILSACAGGHLDTVVYLCGQGNHHDQRVGDQINLVAQVGNLELFKYIVETYQTVPTARAIEFAAQFGHLDIISYIAKEPNHLLFTSKTFELAAQSGNLELVKFIHQQCAPYSELVMNKAATYGHLNVCKWIHENVNGITFSAEIFDGAAINGHIHVVEWLINRGCPITNKSLPLLIKKGLFNIVKIILDQPNVHPPPNQVLTIVAQSGNLDMFLYFIDLVGCGQLTSSALELAVERCHTPIITYIVDRFGTSLITRKVMSAAIVCGNLGIFNYLVQIFQSNPSLPKISTLFDSTEILSAIQNGHVSIYQRLYQIVPELCNSLHDQCLRVAAGNGHHSMVILFKPKNLIQKQNYTNQMTNYILSVDQLQKTKIMEKEILDKQTIMWKQLKQLESLQQQQQQQSYQFQPFNYLQQQSLQQHQILQLQQQLQQQQQQQTLQLQPLQLQPLQLQPLQLQPLQQQQTLQENVQSPLSTTTNNNQLLKLRNEYTEIVRKRNSIAYTIKKHYQWTALGIQSNEDVLVAIQLNKCNAFALALAGGHLAIAKYLYHSYCQQEGVAPRLLFCGVPPPDQIEQLPVEYMQPPRIYQIEQRYVNGLPSNHCLYYPIKNGWVAILEFVYENYPVVFDDPFVKNHIQHCHQTGYSAAHSFLTSKKAHLLVDI
ncbi:hypothetical protein DFA_10017 [Cavenderia fasciculata]|uniref:Ankyrin repeat-containing protein n=1 Tax=Cavenderia fasciculata TaxID=261658 RepID=F4Q922_CACFS|nr:uncharacterized protein DFA_10017 [Cavenderia fasciculata]EGG15191.1 hypothetical protein DFA_10017 [Cavenderia fasciculata]|eukprot:XP_004351911.1 hypothetical protein DFA_10017 [Cavenderia fasciculata]